MTTQNAVPCGLQAVVAIHRNQGQVEVARLKRERVRVTEERDIVKRAAMSFAQESRWRRLHAGTGLGVSRAAHVSSVTGEPKRLLDLAASARESPLGTPIRPLSQRRRVLDQQTRQPTARGRGGTCSHEQDVHYFRATSVHESAALL
jgi:hypothetical protein